MELCCCKLEGETGLHQLNPVRCTLGNRTPLYVQISVVTGLPVEVIVARRIEQCVVRRFYCVG